jgi:hypothetical protein
MEALTRMNPMSVTAIYQHQALGLSSSAQFCAVPEITM